MDLVSSAFDGHQNVCNTTTETRCDGLCCDMKEKEKEQFIVVSAVRLIMALLSIVGALSIVASAVYRKTVCNPRVHPIFVLSVVDTMLSLMWISGSVVWLRGGFQHSNNFRVGCFTINCITVILQCVAMNATLIYALMAYSSIKQRDFSGVYMVQQRTLSVHVWHPLLSFFAYFTAWSLPIPLIMIPFGIIAQQYRMVHLANECSCWCLPYQGNVLPHPLIGPNRLNGKGGFEYLCNLHHYISAYSAVLMVNFTIVLVSMLVIYYKAFQCIRHMVATLGKNENTPLCGANLSMILAGHKDAKKRVFLFISVYFITGITTFLFGIFNIFVEITHHTLDVKTGQKIVFLCLIFEALLVPSQGLMNALAYGWTRGDFLSVMSSRTINRSRPESLAASYDTMDEEKEEAEDTEVEDDGEEFESGGFRGSLLFRAPNSLTGTERRQRGNTLFTPTSPGGLLRGL